MLKKLLSVITAILMISACTASSDDVLTDDLIVSDDDTAIVDSVKDEDKTIDAAINDIDVVTPDQSDNAVTADNDAAAVEDNTVTDEDQFSSSQVCGNSAKEGSEECDGGTIDCATLDGGKMTGTAGCNAQCTGYDTSTCTSSLSSYGTVNANVTAKFILDEQRFNSDQNYIISHMYDLLNEAFTGTYSGGKKIPDETVTSSTRMVFRNNQQNYLFVFQESKIKKSGNDDIFVNPHVHFYFPNPSVKVGKYAVDMVKGAANLYLYDYKEPSNPMNNDRCMLAVGIGGSINVTLAENTANADGGKLNFTGTNIPVYYIKETPYGDLTSFIKSATGLDTCAKR